MSNNLALLPPVITRVYAGVVLAAFLLLTQAINFPTECLGHDISIAENGRHTAGPHEGGASPIHRHAFGEDANQNFAFGYLEFERTADPRGELRRTWQSEWASLNCSHCFFEADCVMAFSMPGYPVRSCSRKMG